MPVAAVFSTISSRVSTPAKISAGGCPLGLPPGDAGYLFGCRVDKGNGPLAVENYDAVADAVDDIGVIFS